MTTEEIKKAIFFETSNNNGKGRRYIAKAYSKHGTGWGIYDRLNDEYVELDQLTEDNFRESIN